MSRMFSITLWVAILLSTPALFLSLATFIFVDGISVLVNIVFAVLYLVVIVFLLSRTPLWPRFKGSGSKKEADSRGRRHHCCGARSLVSASSCCLPVRSWISRTNSAGISLP